MSHTITFIGSENPNCFTSSFLEVPDPALVIESELVNDRLPLGNIFELQANSTGPDVVTVFGRDDSGPVSQFHSVQVTLFGGVFESEATVRNDQLTISTSSGSVFGYPAELTVTAPSNKTDWQDLKLTVDGSLLSGNGSFVQKLSEVVIRKIIDLAEIGHVHRRIAQRAVERSIEMLTATECQFNDVVEHLKRTDESKAVAHNATQTVQTEFTALEQEIVRSGGNLGDIVGMLNGLCRDDPYESSCMPGELCRSCTSPSPLSQCPTVIVPCSSCHTGNRVCKSARQRALDSLEGLTMEERELLQRFLDTQSALVSAQTDLRKAELENEMYLEKRDQLNMSLIRFRDEHNRSVAVYNSVLEEVETLVGIYESGNGNRFENIFTISAVTFSTILTHNPTSLALNVAFQKQICDVSEDYQEYYLYISSQSEATNLERIANDIIVVAFTHSNNRQVTCSINGTSGNAEFKCRPGQECIGKGILNYIAIILIILSAFSVCPLGQFRSGEDCQPCPENTAFPLHPSHICPCKVGYFRNTVSHPNRVQFEDPINEEASHKCTSKQTPQFVRIT